ncbi:MAG: type VII toxin-antitoxin system MntA family adenylyltransferase antitoxin [Planctomycetota bacterium]|jgi:predicted nucleotidyltransferase
MKNDVVRADSLLIEKVREAVSSFPEISLCTVFGSAAKGKLKSSSDMDISVTAKHPLTAQLKIDLIGKLASVCGRSIDLIDLQTARGPIFQEALSGGILILKKDASVYAELLKKMWYHEADEMPNYRMILKKRRERFLNA